VHTVGYEVVLESLPLPLAQPEYGAVKSTVVIEILNGGAAILSYVSSRACGPRKLMKITPSRMQNRRGSERRD
jgi:hypothetical protein